MEMIIEGYDIRLIDKVNALGKLVGNTPLVPIENVYQKKGVKIFAKLEWQQFGGSVKARPAFNIVKEAILKGELTPGKEILDASSGNTGIAFAAIGAALGIPVNICIPENASEERKTLLKAYGANIYYTSRFDSTDGAQIKAKELFSSDPGKYYYADQYANENNWKAHYNSTAPEIFRQTDKKITHFVAGLGTTGTFTGTGRRLKELNPDIELISLQPETALHGLEGWKHLETAMVPKIFDDHLEDKRLLVDTLSAYDLIRQTAIKEGFVLSPSAAANLQGAIKIAESIDEGIIVTVFPDNSDKYSEIINQIIS